MQSNSKLQKQITIVQCEKTCFAAVILDKNHNPRGLQQDKFKLLQIHPQNIHI